MKWMVGQFHFQAALLLSKKPLAHTYCWGVEGYSGHWRKVKPPPPTGNTTWPFRNLVACLIIFLDPLSSYGSYSENQRQAVVLLPAANNRLLFAVTKHTNSPYAHSVNSVRSQARLEIFCWVIIGVTGYFVGGWARVTWDILEKQKTKLRIAVMQQLPMVSKILTKKCKPLSFNWQ